MSCHQEFLKEKVVTTSVTTLSQPINEAIDGWAKKRIFESLEDVTSIIDRNFNEEDA